MKLYYYRFYFFDAGIIGDKKGFWEWVKARQVYENAFRFPIILALEE